MRTKPIVVLGAGGLARETMWLIEAINATCGAYRPLGISTTIHPITVEYCVTIPYWAGSTGSNSAARTIYARLWGWASRHQSTALSDELN
ncbi:MAG: hypothetical protein KKI02_11605, partial [Planctomycetes bacterium]|nr:hypothetical protein [Planctomycetota bacterium]